MDLEQIKLEIQKRQGDIQSLQADHARVRSELEEVYAAESRYGERLSGSEYLPKQLERIENQIRSLQREIESLMDQAREKASSQEDRKLNPLEALGAAALMWADGKLSDEDFEQMLEKVRQAIK